MQIKNMFTAGIICLKQDLIHREYKDSYLNLLFIIPQSHHGWIVWHLYVIDQTAGRVASIQFGWMQVERGREYPTGTEKFFRLNQVQLCSYKQTESHIFHSVHRVPIVSHCYKLVHSFRVTGLFIDQFNTKDYGKFKDVLFTCVRYFYRYNRVQPNSTNSEQTCSVTYSCHRIHRILI